MTNIVTLTLWVSLCLVERHNGSYTSTDDRFFTHQTTAALERSADFWKEAESNWMILSGMNLWPRETWSHGNLLNQSHV